MSTQESRGGIDILGEGDERPLHSWLYDDPDSLPRDVSSVLSSEIAEGEGATFQIELGDLFKDERQSRDAATQSDRLSAWSSFIACQSRLRALRLRADRHRQTARLKRHEMRNQIQSVQDILHENRSKRPSTDLPRISEQLNTLEHSLFQLESLEEHLDKHEVDVIKAEWAIANTTPQPLNPQTVDDTFKILVENNYHFPAEEDTGSASDRSSLREDLPGEASTILSKIEAVDAIEQKIMELKTPSFGLPPMSEAPESLQSHPTAEQAAEIQQLQSELAKATSELEEFRDHLQPAPDLEPEVPFDPPGSSQPRENVAQSEVLLHLDERATPINIASALLDPHGVTTIFPPEYLGGDNEPLNKYECVNRWLLNCLRFSDGEIGRYKEYFSFNLLVPVQIPAELDIRNLALRIWFDEPVDDFQRSGGPIQLGATSQRSIQSTADTTRQLTHKSETLPRAFRRFNSNMQTSANPGSSPPLLSSMRHTRSL